MSLRGRGEWFGRRFARLRAWERLGTAGGYKAWMRTWRDGEGVGGLGTAMLCFRDQGKDAKEVLALGRTLELSPSFMRRSESGGHVFIIDLLP